MAEWQPVPDDEGTVESRVCLDVPRPSRGSRDMLMAHTTPPEVRETQVAVQNRGGTIFQLNSLTGRLSALALLLTLAAAAALGILHYWDGLSALCFHAQFRRHLTDSYAEGPSSYDDKLVPVRLPAAGAHLPSFIDVGTSCRWLKMFCGWTTTTSTATATTTTATMTTATTTTTTTQPGLWGEYGFLTNYSVTPREAVQRVQKMVEVFNIREFQFYDAVSGYSHPPEESWASWLGTFARTVNRSTIQAYTDEIRRLGARSWLYVQAQGSDVNDTALQAGFKLLGQHKVDGVPLMDIIEFNEEWGHRIAPQWADFAKSLGFDGIHWDIINMAGDLPGFLRGAYPHMVARGLRQTANFINGYLWKDSLLHDGIVVFPYWEVWIVPQVEDAFFNSVRKWGGGVFVCYPGTSKTHENEQQNTGLAGVYPLDVMIMRWQKAHKYGAVYLAIGDGLRHIQTCYFPDTAAISDADVKKIRQKVFSNGKSTSIRG